MQLLIFILFQFIKLKNLVYLTKTIDYLIVSSKKKKHLQIIAFLTNSNRIKKNFEALQLKAIKSQ